MVLPIVFFSIESRTRGPLIPLHMFRLSNLTVASVAAMLWAAAMFAWFFISALCLQLVLRYNPTQVGLAFQLFFPPP